MYVFFPVCSGTAFEVVAANEHIATILYLLGSPSSAYINGFQHLTPPEHTVHGSYVLCVEGAQVEGLQAIAASKHANHIGDGTSVEVLDTHYFCKISHTVEPLHCTDGTGGDERRVKHNFSNRRNEFVQIIIIIKYPRWCRLGARQAIFIAYLVILLTVGIEGKCGRCLIIDDIWSVNNTRKVARIARATVDVSVGSINIAAIEHCAITTYQVGATSEHLSRLCHTLCAPTCIDHNGRERGATFKHATHVSHLSSVEHRQVEPTDTRVVIEHSAHVGDVRRAEAFMIGDGIDYGRGASVCEHIAHIRDIRGREILAEGEGSQVGAAFEHIVHTLSLARIESAQVKSGKTVAIREHVGEIGLIACVEIFQTLDCCKVRHTSAIPGTTKITL